MKKILIILLAIATLLTSAPASAGELMIYYSDQEPSRSFVDYDVIVFDSDNYPAIEPLLERGKTVLGYISLGEIEKNRHYFKKVKSKVTLLGENPVWKGSYYIDMRDRDWAKMVLEQFIPDIIHKGFSGLFLDTLDNPGHLERTNNKNRGMVKASINLVKAIKLHYPNLKIMMNRGYELLPELAGVIDMELGESVYTDYDFDKKEYDHVKKKLYKQQVSILKKAQQDNPNLKIYTLDYWNPEDGETITEIYKEQRENGFIPYVATVKLDKVVKEPKHD